MKKIFTLALAAAATLGASAAGYQVMNLNAQKINHDGVAKLNNLGIKGMTSRADEGLPVGETMVFGNAYVESQNALVGVSARFDVTANIEQDGDKYYLSLPMFEGEGIENVKVELTYDAESSAQVKVPVFTSGELPVVAKNVPLNDGSRVDVLVANGTVSSDGNCGIFGNLDLYTQFPGLSQAVPWTSQQNPNAAPCILFVIERNGKYSIVDVIGDLALPIPNAKYESTVSYQAESGVVTESESGDCYVIDYEGEFNDGTEFNVVVGGLGQAFGPAPAMVEGTDFYAPAQYVGLYVDYDLAWMGEQGADAIEGEVLEDGKVYDIPAMCYAVPAAEAIIYDYQDVKVTRGNNSAIDNINADNTNAPVEYYNLQGMKVNAPAAGQIVIRRQGTEATKILVK